MSLIEQQKEIAKNLHPELAKSMLAVYNEPKVKEAMETLGKYGLGAFIPHKHGNKDELIPLPSNEYQNEKELKISFHKHNLKKKYNGVFVGWRVNNSELEFTTYCIGSSSGRHIPKE